MLKGLSLSSLPREKIAEGSDILRPGDKVSIFNPLLKCRLSSVCNSRNLEPNLTTPRSNLASETMLLSKRRQGN